MNVIFGDGHACIREKHCIACISGFGILLYRQSASVFDYFFCLSLRKKSDPQIGKVAFVVDAGGKLFLMIWIKQCCICNLKQIVKLLFVDADDEVLIQRYKLMRRKHLMAEHERIEGNHYSESVKHWKPLRKIANYYIDTCYER